MDLILENVTQHNLRIDELKIPLHKLVGVSGPSGSGKSSLVVHTIFAESQRRFFSSLSTYQRQFFEKWARPQVEAIHNLGASLFVGQKNVIRNSRATVASTSGLLPLLSNIWAYTGEKFCITCESEVKMWDSRKLVEVLAKEQGQLWLGFIFTLSDQKNIFQDEIKVFLRQGLNRICKVNDLKKGTITIYELQNESLLKNIKGEDVIFICDVMPSQHLTEEKVDECIRLSEAWSPRLCAIWPQKKSFAYFATQDVCSACGTHYGVLYPDHFSFTSSVGSCPDCKGFGAKRVIDLDEITLRYPTTLSLADGFLPFLETPRFKPKKKRLLDKALEKGVPVNKPWGQLTQKQKDLFLYGEGSWKGLKQLFDRLESRMYKMHVRIFLNRFRSEKTCETCQGTRLIPKSRAVRVMGKPLHEIMSWTLLELFHWVQALPTTEKSKTLVEPLQSRMHQLLGLGLGYLSINRKSKTLSGGEVQRLSLIHHLGTGLSDMLYVLDEPSIGLHPRDAQHLVKVCQDLVTRGNHCLVIEHDRNILAQLDTVIEMGPGSGREGGAVVWKGSGKAWQKRQENKYTKISPFAKPYTPKLNQWIEIKGAQGHNLKDVTCRFPQNALVGVCGVSGSGKTSPILKTLVPTLEAKFGKDNQVRSLPVESIEFSPGSISDVEYISQDLPIRSSRANLLTYTGAFDLIRKFFSKSPDAQKKKFKPGHFSFNSDLGRCLACKGLGEIIVEMVFMEDLRIPCDDCSGLKFQAKVLAIRYRGQTIADILDMTADDLCEFFDSDRRLKFIFTTLKSVGLGYLKAGQGCHTYSGGELQRLKIARIFLHPTKRKVLYVLDEPTTGLHWQEVQQLLFLFGQMISQGHSVVVIEHHPEVLASTDYLIELGPGGGGQGGRVIFQGPPKNILQRKTSPTAPFLQGL
jgi:excinuclease ABC subunit A